MGQSRGEQRQCSTQSTWAALDGPVQARHSRPRLTVVEVGDLVLATAHPGGKSRGPGAESRLGDARRPLAAAGDNPGGRPSGPRADC